MPEEGKGFFSVIGEPIAQAMVEHSHAPPLRKNQNRVVYGTWFIVAGVYGAQDFIVRNRVDVGKLASAAVRDPSGTASAVGTPFLVWCGMALFGLLWVAVGLRRTRAPREIMGGFWSLLAAGGCAYALFHGAYLAGDVEANWWLKGFYLATLAASLMSLFVFMRGAGGGNAAQLVQKQIQREARPWRIGRRRNF